jgi:PIN domain nuclease of toxin-antitoxin system
MSSFLLDTHLLLWVAFEPEKLSSSARMVLNDPSNSLSFSSASIWEVVVKRALNKPDFQFDPILLRRLLVDDGYREIDITSVHALHVALLQQLHKDPFDRLLIAQAEVEGLTLLTADKKIAGYSASIQLV